MAKLILDDEQTYNCIVKIFVNENEKPNGYGFFVAPNQVLTCFHVIEGLANDVKIQWGNQKSLSAQVTSSNQDLDLALLSVELVDHPYLLLNEDIVSFETLRVYRPHGYTALTVKGFVGNTESIMLEAGGNDVDSGDSGMPLIHPRTGGVCGLISGGCKWAKAIEAIHIKNSKRLPKLASNIVKIFIVYDKSDEGSFDALVQALRETNLTNLALYWEDKEYVKDKSFMGEEEAQWAYEADKLLSCPKSFNTANIIILLVSSKRFDGYYKNYVLPTRERYESGEIQTFQVLPSKAFPVEDWPKNVMVLEEVSRAFPAIISQ